MKTLWVKVCPQCGSPDIYYEAGYTIGEYYRCNNCGYVGPFVIEKKVVVDDKPEKD